MGDYLAAAIAAELAVIAVVCIAIGAGITALLFWIF